MVYRKGYSTISVNPTFTPSNTLVSPSNIWYDDCSDPNNWLFENTSTLNIDWRIETDPTMPAGGALTPFLSATASNGFMFVNSDADGGSTDMMEQQLSVLLQMLHLLTCPLTLMFNYHFNITLDGGKIQE